jgi:hypothetical protein
MDRDEQARMARLNREAAREKGPDDPHATRPRDVKPLIVLICLGLVVAVAALGWMWVNNTRYDGTSPAPVAEQRR